RTLQYGRRIDAVSVRWLQVVHRRRDHGGHPRLVGSCEPEEDGAAYRFCEIHSLPGTSEIVYVGFGTNARRRRGFSTRIRWRLAIAMGAADGSFSISFRSRCFRVVILSE